MDKVNKRNDYRGKAILRDGNLLRKSVVSGKPGFS
jgi:hypothetical protein